LENFDCASSFATELPTVPKPSRATFNVEFLCEAALFEAETRFPAVFFWAIAI
jgi:hypothetical protein